MRSPNKAGSSTSACKGTPMARYSESASTCLIARLIIPNWRVAWSEQVCDSLVMLSSNRLKVWNPGRLPSPLNPAKLQVARASVPVNRLIGESLYLNEHIELMGTGTLDMVRRCTEVRMPEPDFSDTGQFVTTVWRTSMVTIRCDGHPVSDANVLMLLPNGTWNRATANENGEALLQTESRGVPLDVLVAAKGFSAHVERGWVPAVHPLSLELQGVDGGAAIFSALTGELPGLKGLLKFTRDSRGRIYLNAANVSINDSQPQPVQCSLGEELHLVDSDGDDLNGAHCRCRWAISASGVPHFAASGQPESRVTARLVAAARLAARLAARVTARLAARVTARLAAAARLAARVTAAARLAARVTARVTGI